MYFSKRDNEIYYVNTYDGPLEVHANGPLCKEDTKVTPSLYKDWYMEYSEIELMDGVTEVGEGFLDFFTPMRTLIIHRSVTNICVSEKLREFLKANKVHIRGFYGSYGERFAKENGLRFSQCDIEVGWRNGSSSDYSTKFTILFSKTGQITFQFDTFWPGTSAGNMGGGTTTNKMSSHHFDGMTFEQFLEEHKEFSEDIAKNEELKFFFEHKKR